MKNELPQKLTRLWFITSALATAAVIATRGTLHANPHATLLSAEPKAGSALTKSPDRIRLVFSEAIDVSVSGMRLTPATGTARVLPVNADPHDVAALIAPLDPLPAGTYTVAWHTVSVDGHPVSGTLSFSIAGAPATAVVTAEAPMPKPMPSSVDSPTLGPSIFGAPVLASLLRGLALGCVMGFAGLLFFIRRASVDARRALNAARWLMIAAFVFLTAHVFAWAASGPAVLAMLNTSTGHLEIARVTAVLLAIWAFSLARRELLALMFAAIALVISGAIGHPAAMHPAITIPAKAIHLSAGAAWLGGLLWLLLADRTDVAAFAREAHRVSTAALISVGLVIFSGLGETFNFLVPPSNLFHTTYGAITMAKMTGATILVLFGAYNRYREIPALDAGDGSRLGRSVRLELTVMAAVILIGGLLAYVSPHPS